MAPASAVTTAKAESLLLTKQTFRRREPPESMLGNDLFHTLTGCIWKIEEWELGCVAAAVGFHEQSWHYLVAHGVWYRTLCCCGCCCLETGCCLKGSPHHLCGQKDKYTYRQLYITLATGKCWALKATNARKVLFKWHFAVYMDHWLDLKMDVIRAPQKSSWNISFHPWWWGVVQVTNSSPSMISSMTWTKLNTPIIWCNKIGWNNFLWFHSSLHAGA